GRSIPTGAGLARADERTQLEDTAIDGNFVGMMQVNLVDQPSHREAAWDLAHHRHVDIAEEVNSLGLVELDGADCLLVAAVVDRRPAVRAQVAHPIHIAPRRPYPAPTFDVDDRHAGCSRLASLAAANCDQAI